MQMAKKLNNMSGKKYSVGIYEHEDTVKSAVKALQDGGVKIHEV